MLRPVCLLAILCAPPLLAQDQDPPRRRPEPPKVEPKVKPAGAAVDIAAATKAGVEAILKLQEGDDRDQWPYEGVYREDRGQLPVGYRVGGTAITCLGLIAAPGYRDDKLRQEALTRGVAFILKTLDHPRMQTDFVGTYDVRGWGHIYALQLFLHLQDRKLTPEAHVASVAERTKWLVAALVESAIPEAGGWNYSRRAGYKATTNAASTFMTPPALQALFHAKARGHEVPDAVLDQALAALERCRAKPGGYSYGAGLKAMGEVDEGELTMMDKTPSSAARATACEAALLLAGRGDQARLRRAIELFFSHWDDLAVRKQQTGTHIPPYGIAPYYFMYGHVYCAQAIELLDDEVAKQDFRARMAVIVERSRDEDGSWNDRHFGRSAGYGTALAIMTMQMPHLPRPVPLAPPRKG